MKNISKCIIASLFAIFFGGSPNFLNYEMGDLDMLGLQHIERVVDHLPLMTYGLKLSLEDSNASFKL